MRCRAAGSGVLRTQVSVETLPGKGIRLVVGGAEADLSPLDVGRLRAELRAQLLAAAKSMEEW